MKIPKKQRKYCNYCRKHTEHTLEEAKKKPRRTLARSQRRFLRVMKGYGSFPKKNPKAGKNLPENWILDIGVLSAKRLTQLATVLE